MCLDKIRFEDADALLADTVSILEIRSTPDDDHLVRHIGIDGIVSVQPPVVVDQEIILVTAYAEPIELHLDEIVIDPVMEDKASPDVLEVSTEEEAHLMLHADRVAEDHAVVTGLKEGERHAHIILCDTLDADTRRLKRSERLDQVRSCMDGASWAVDIHEETTLLLDNLLCHGMVKIHQALIDKTCRDGSIDMDKPMPMKDDVVHLWHWDTLMRAYNR